MSELVRHAFEPVADKNSRVLILGTMPSPASREQGFYYSHPRNRFWPVLAALYSVQPPRTPAQKAEFVLSRRIALWDVLRCCRIEGASDASIREPAPNDIPGLLACCPGITTVFTTGATAARLCRASFPVLTAERIELPSTSPANCRMSLETLVEVYRVVALRAGG